MLSKIVARLKTGSIKNVVPFGSIAQNPSYIVVKPERAENGIGRRFRIIVHMKPDQQEFLEDYIFNELSTLLTDYQVESRHGNLNQLIMEDDNYTDITISNSDGTISMERCFIMPSKLF